MYETPDPVPEGDPEGSMGYHAKFRMKDGLYAGHDFLLRGLGETYSVDRIMGLLEMKCGLPPENQEWRVPVVNFDEPLRRYGFADGDTIEVWPFGI